MSAKHTITFGGWYQRTTLHLTEVYDLFALGTSRLPLDSKKLKTLQKSLNAEKITRESEDLEYVKVITRGGIEIRYFEDGLYILETTSYDIHAAQLKLTQYFENIFEPAMGYIFSLGAPTPKILANLKINHPTVIGIIRTNPEKFRVDIDYYGQVYSQVSSGSVSVFKTPGYIFIVTTKKSMLDHLVETQVFFREFKDQLQRYLNIHRKVWEEIARIKEKGEIKGGDVGELRAKLESYLKTIQLISNRINQMGSYIGARSWIAKSEKVDEKMLTLFQYKFETLKDTHSYIKEIWKMTLDYVNSAIKVMEEIEGKSTANNIRSLQVITTVGVISGILGYLARDEIPQITPFGFLYFAVLLFATYLVNKAIAKYYTRRKYKITFTERAGDI